MNRFPYAQSQWMLVGVSGESEPEPGGVNLLDTLISYWKLDEGTGATCNDSQGTNHLLPLAGGGSTGFGGIINQGQAFSGGCLNCASNATLQVTGDFTFSLWVAMNAQANYFILAKGDAAATTQFFISYNGGTGAGFQFTSLVGGTTASVSANTTLSTFHHLVCWYDSSDGKCRIRVNDTTTYESVAGTLAVTNASPFALGAIRNGAGIFGGLSGIIDEVGFWKRVLTAQEITALYNGGSGLAYSSFTA